MATESHIKLAAFEPYLDHVQAAEIVAAHYGEPLGVARIQVERTEKSQVLEGF